MKVDEKKIEMVLAMFDSEDIPYINPKMKLDCIELTDSYNFQKVKEVGACNDRQRK